MFNISLSRDECLVVVCSGTPVLTDYLATVGLISEVLQRDGGRHVLTDLTRIAYGLQETERLELVRITARRLRNVRLAVAVATPWRMKNPELVARAVGLQVRVFEDVARARDWLLRGAGSHSRVLS